MQMMVGEFLSFLSTVFFMLCICGYSIAASNKTQSTECWDLKVCITPEVEKALFNDDIITLCTVAGGAVDCIDVFISKCEHSIDVDKQTFKKIRKELLRIRKSLTRNCKQFTKHPTTPDFPSKTTACDPAAMAACASKMKEPDMNNLEPYCQSIVEAKECTQAEINKCPDGATKDAMMKSLAGFDQAAAQCGGSKCSMVKVQECSAGLGQFDNKTGNLKDYCVKLAKGKMCLEKLVVQCEEGPSKTAIQDMLKGIKKPQSMCGDIGKTDDNNGNGASIPSQQAFLCVVLMLTVKLIGGHRDLLF